MKTTSIFLVIAMFGLFLSSVSAQNNQSLSLVTNVNLDNVQRVALQPAGDLTISHWDNSYAKVEILITAADFKRSQLKSLLKLGLFSLKTEKVEQVAILDMPGLHREVSVGGNVLAPQLKFHLTLPRSVKMEQVGFSSEMIADAR